MAKHLLLLLHLIRLLVVLSKPQGTKALLAENLMLRKQLIIIARKYKRAPNLSLWDRLTFALFGASINLTRLKKIAVIIKPATIIKFHQALIKRKYQLLFSSLTPKKPGPKGPSKELRELIVEMKRRNPQFGCPRIAMQIQNTFGIPINKDVVRRVLANYFKPPTNNHKGPSWLSFIGNMKDSLWSIDLFRCESIVLKSHWVMVLMDQFSRRIIGFAIHKGHVSGTMLCYMFNSIISKMPLPTYLSSDNDPLFLFHRWQANLRILEIEEIKTLPGVPISHPFIERLIKSIRHELLDRTLFWNAFDLQHKLNQYQVYFNTIRSHQSLDALTPSQMAFKAKRCSIKLISYRWQSHCHGLFQLPITA